MAVSILFPSAAFARPAEKHSACPVAAIAVLSLPGAACLEPRRQVDVFFCSIPEFILCIDDRQKFQGRNLRSTVLS